MTTKTEQANKHLTWRFVEEVVNQGHIERIGELFAPEFVEHSLPEGRKANLTGLKQTFYKLRTAFPDIHQTVGKMLAEGDKIAFAGAHTCTQLGDFFGYPATGRPAKYVEFHMARVEDNRFVEHWSEVDRLGLYQQLGMVPSWSSQHQEPGAPIPGRKPPSAAAAEPPDPEEMRAIMQRFFAEVWSKGNMDVVDELISPSVVPYDPLGVAGPGDGPDGVRKLVKSLRDGFPDMHTVPQDIVVDGDWAMTRWNGTGTHNGYFMGREPTGQVVEVSGMSITRIENGQFVEAGDSWDTLGLMQQLGAVPAGVGG